MVNRLSTIYHLQLIDDQLDELEELRGDLPLLVSDLTSSIQEKKDLIEAKENEKEESIEKRKTNEEEVERLSENLKKYKAQLYQVRNNKEYDALTKEIDHSEVEIDRLKKENEALEELMEKLKIEVGEVKPELEELELELEEKEEQLKKIVKANEKEEVRLRDKREQVAEKLKKYDYNNYMRVRKALGGKAMVPVERSACGGCHAVVPPQRQIEVRQNRRIYSCESCGRMLVSAEIAEDVQKEFNAS